MREVDNDSGDDTPSFLENTEDDISTSPLYQELLDHCTKQLDSGVPLEDILSFVNSPELVRHFFEGRGHPCDFKDDCNEDDEVESLRQRDVEIVEDTSASNRANPPPEVVGIAKEGTTKRLRSVWRLSKLFKITLYAILVSVISLVCHVGICHLLDVNPLSFFPGLQEKRCLLPTHPMLMEMFRPIAECGFCSNKNETVIEMKGSPSRAEFAKVAYLSKPVIIRGGYKTGTKPMVTNFDFHQLKQIFQSEPGGVDAVSEECQFLQFRSPFASLKEAFEKIPENSDWDEPWYIGWSNCHPGVGAKLRDLFPRPDFLPEDSSSSVIDWIFIGSPGLGASMHIDYVKRPSWQAQLSGTKRWLLHPPPECEAVCPESLVFTINPGDLLFLETNTWYHETFIDGNALSISIGSEYD